MAAVVVEVEEEGIGEKEAEKVYKMRLRESNGAKIFRPHHGAHCTIREYKSRRRASQLSCAVCRAQLSSIR